MVIGRGRNIELSSHKIPKLNAASEAPSEGEGESGKEKATITIETVGHISQLAQGKNLVTVSS